MNHWSPVRWTVWLWFFASAAPARGGDEIVRLSVVATSDFHGSLEMRSSRSRPGERLGGIDMLAAYIEAVRRANPGGVIVLDAGDVYQGTLLSAANEGKAVIEFFNEIGYDAIAVGNHDFDYGPEGYHSTPLSPKDNPLGVIQKRIAEARFPFLAANIYERATEKPVVWRNLLPFRIVTRKGVRVAVVGLTAEDVPLTTHPANVQSLQFRPLLEELRRVLPEARARGATVFIVVAHTGFDRDERTGEMKGPLAELAAGLEPGEVDLIVGGHMHRPLAARVNGIPIVQAGAYGMTFARAELAIDPKTKRSISERAVLEPDNPVRRPDETGKPVPFLGGFVLPEPRFERRLQAYRRGVQHLENIRLGAAAQTLANQCSLDSPLGGLVTDAIRAYDPAIQIAMFNSGGLRASIPEGPITFGRIYEVLPFDNTLIVLTLTGAEVREILEHGLADHYGAMEISGIRVFADMGARKGERCRLICLESGAELLPDESYVVATNDFVFNGGDGYTTFSQGRQVRQTHSLIRELVAAYIKQKGTVELPAGPRYLPALYDGASIPP